MDKEYRNIREKTTENEANCVKTEFGLNIKGLLLHKRRLYIPNSEETKLIIMNELHKISY